MNQPAIIKAILEERDRQDIKWGVDRHLSDGTWMLILVEELGEYSKAVLEQDFENSRKELVQAAAVALAWLEDRLRNL